MIMFDLSLIDTIIRSSVPT